MTAIAFRDGIMAADSACWVGRTITGYVKKIHRLADGSLVGVSGDYAYACWWLGWLADGAERSSFVSPPEDGFTALMVRQDGSVFKYSNPGFYEVAAPFHAIGCLPEFLSGAMHAGASAKDAVRMAIEHTDGAAGPLVIARL